jgi:hypothetical protein
VVDPGVGCVVKSFVDSTMIRSMVRKLELKIHMMQNAARKNPDSSRKTTVLEAIIRIVHRVFKCACVLHGDCFSLNASGHTLM